MVKPSILVISPRVNGFGHGISHSWVLLLVVMFGATSSFGGGLGESEPPGRDWPLRRCPGKLLLPRAGLRRMRQKPALVPRCSRHLARMPPSPRRIRTCGLHLGASSVFRWASGARPAFRSLKEVWGSRSASACCCHLHCKPRCYGTPLLAHVVGLRLPGC